MYIAGRPRQNGNKTAIKWGPAWANTGFPLTIWTSLTDSMGLLCRGKFADLGPRMMQFCPCFTPVEGPNLACLKSSGDSPLTSAGGISGP